MAARYLRFINWERYQHYKQQRTKEACPPPWIKLYTSLLESEGYAELPEPTQAHLIKLLLLAARTKNKINANPSSIRHMIHAKSPIRLDLLMSCGMLEYVQDASSVLAACKQDARPRREEKRREDSENDAVLAGREVKPEEPPTEDVPDEVCELVQAWGSIWPAGMLAIGSTQRAKVQELIDRSGGKQEAHNLLIDATTRKVRAPFEYAMKVAKDRQADADLASNRKSVESLALGPHRNLI